jgi:hypothetical protein
MIDDALDHEMGRAHGNCGCASASPANHLCLQITLSITMNFAEYYYHVYDTYRRCRRGAAR